MVGGTMEETNHIIRAVSSECIIGAIKHCSKNGFHDLIGLIKSSKITEKFDEIIKAWDKAKKRYNEQDYGVTESVLAQKQSLGACQ